jgi:hypothetical protein
MTSTDVNARRLRRYADPRLVQALEAFGANCPMSNRTLLALAGADLDTPEKLLAFPAGELWRVRGVGSKALLEIETWRGGGR